MPCLETICIAFCNVVHLHLTFLSDRFKYLMLFTNLHFSSSTYLTLLYQYCLSVATKTFGVLGGASGFLYFLVIPQSPPTGISRTSRFPYLQHVDNVCKPNIQKVNIYRIAKKLSVNLTVIPLTK